MKSTFDMHADKHRSLLQVVNFLPADKQKKFLQDDKITLDVCSQACPKYTKQEKHEG